MVQVTSPNAIQKVRPTAQYSREQNNHLLLIEQALDQLYRRSGGSVDLVVDSSEEYSANENQIAHIYGLVADLTEAVNDLAADSTGDLVTQDFRAITKNSNYTAVDRDFVNAKQNATITLDSHPAENSVIIIRNGDGSKIKMNGNGRTINGSSTGNIRNKGTALVLHYFIDTDEWLVR